MPLKMGFLGFFSRKSLNFSQCENVAHAQMKQAVHMPPTWSSFQHCSLQKMYISCTFYSISTCKCIGSAFDCMQNKISIFDILYDDQMNDRVPVQSPRLTWRVNLVALIVVCDCSEAKGRAVSTSACDSTSSSRENNTLLLSSPPSCNTTHQRIKKTLL